MEKTINDMARAMIALEVETETRDHVAYDLGAWEDTAKAALAALPPFIVLDEGAEPEVGDLISFGIRNNETVYRIAERAFVENWDSFHNPTIHKRKGIPVLLRTPKGKQ